MEQGYVPYQSQDIESSGDEQQLRQYELLSKLQNLVKQLPSKMQQRLSHTLLSDIACCLLDQAIFTIVNDLQEIQHLTEKNLYNQRQKMLVDHKGLKQEMKIKHQEETQTARSHNAALIKSRQEKEKQTLDKRLKEELHQMDMKLQKELDQRVTGQQATLQSAGVTGFFITSDPKEIKLQMVILQLIKDLAAQ
uniref:Protein DGCR6-like n=1 Tax=Phallusia mammillata TaxID=59560 RepID=A0A6F9DBE4_9ASCI|nr:protein DGCR6-like [Phallusia mammillata]